MDSGQYQSAYPYEQLFRPEYPTPPPSFPHYQSQVDEYSEYMNYAYSPISPNISSNGCYQSYAQTPTPIDSLTSSPQPNELTLSTAAMSHDTVSISTAFNPGATPAPDTLLSSFDDVIFYVHAQTILDCCPTSFGPYLSAPLSDPQFRNKVIRLDAPSAELNVILHTLYGTSAAAHSPDIETLVRAVDRMPTYGLPPQSLIRPSTPLHDLLLSRAPLHPLAVYALASRHGLSSLAITVSSHLLLYDLATITDEMAERIGAVYLKKLFSLHVGRYTSLKGILLHPPHPHPPTKQCGFEDQKKLTRAWALVSAYLAWDVRPALSTHSLQSALNPLMEHLTCKMCHQALKDRIKDAVVQWASVKNATPSVDSGVVFLMMMG